jgi:FlaA1/EpsC-like NDP-sugar epimerase
VRSINGFANDVSIIGCASTWLDDGLCYGGGNQREFVDIRFGNVPENYGRVDPSPRMQMPKGGRMAVTHPSMKGCFIQYRRPCDL